MPAEKFDFHNAQGHTLAALPAAAAQNAPSESRCMRYIAVIANNRKEVIQCLIVYRRGRRHS
jgi:hypothetical protein